MTKIEFLKQLEHNLSMKLNKTETKRIIDYYEGYFAEANEYGKSDADLISEIGDIKQLAKTIIDGLDGQSLDQENDEQIDSSSPIFEFSVEDDEPQKVKFSYNHKSNKMLKAAIAVLGVLIALCVIVLVVLVLGLVSVLIIPPVGITLLGVFFIVLVCLVISIPFKIVRGIRRSVRKNSRKQRNYYYDNDIIDIDINRNKQRSSKMQLYKGQQSISLIDIHGANISVDIEFVDEDYIEVVLDDDFTDIKYSFNFENGQLLFHEDTHLGNLMKNSGSPKLHISIPDSNNTFDIIAEVANGKVKVISDGVIINGNCNIQTANGKIYVEGISCNDMKIETVNGKIELDDCFFNHGKFDTVNGKIICSLEHPDGEDVDYDLSITTVNGSVLIDGDKFKKGIAGITSIKTSYSRNSDIRTNISASTINGSVELNGINH